MHCAERVSDRAVASGNSGSEEGKEDRLGGLWRDCEGEKRERRPVICFRRPKTSDVRPATIAAIFIRWDVKRTPNAMKLGRRSTNNKKTPHANFHPILRTFSGHS